MSMKSITIDNKGFTLVELLVVISMVGILTGVTLALINPVKQRKIAEDGVKQSNLQKYALGIEAYGNANLSYPADADSNQQPDGATTFVNIPDQPSGATYLYYVNAGQDTFAVLVMGSDDTTRCYKYVSSVGKIQSCPNATSCTGIVTTGCL